MDLKTAVNSMLPSWFLGATIVCAVLQTKYKDLVRVEAPAAVKWIKFLALLTLYRFALLKIFPSLSQDKVEAITSIPWPLAFGVFWEDAVFSLPLLLLRYVIGTRWFTWPLHASLLAFSMINFGMGHVYQGNTAAMILSLYIPAGIYLGKKYGYGTVMIGHTLYDLTTILTLKMIAGA